MQQIKLFATWYSILHGVRTWEKKQCNNQRSYICTFITIKTLKRCIVHMLLCSNSNSAHKCFLNPVLRLSIKSAKKSHQWNKSNQAQTTEWEHFQSKLISLAHNDRKRKRVREKEKINEYGAIKWGRNEISLPPRLSLSAGFTWIGRVICGREREEERKVNVEV